MLDCKVWIGDTAPSIGIFPKAPFVVGSATPVEPWLRNCFALRMKVENEVKLFKAWASTQDQRGEWETEYPRWQAFEAAVLDFLEKTKSAEWDDKDWQNIIFVVARDNECETFIGKISEDKELLLSLAHQALTSHESKAKWQIAAYLGETAALELAEPILLAWVTDANEYVSRRSLIALSILGSKETEKLAKMAWATEHEYQRIAALQALGNIASKELEQFLRLAKDDGRIHLVKKALQLQRAD